VLVLKKLAPVRLKKNDFAMRAVEAQLTGATRDEELELLGRKREMRGIFEGDLIEGELEMGQSSGLVKDIPTVEEMMKRLLSEYDAALSRMRKMESL